MAFKQEFPMRRTKDQILDTEEILKIIEAARYIHWGLKDKRSLYPYVVTTDYGYEYVDNVLRFYIHGAPAGRKLNLIREDPHVGFNLEADANLWRPQKEHDYNFTTNYESVVGTALAEEVDDPREKAHGLSLLIKHEAHEIFQENEYADHDLSYVKILKFTVQNLSAKHHFRPKM
ncbi:pyridoxamine 5'-phosphate oxidase family protein [Lactobacillus sp. ESL0791]|uniref:pyridoxamine 5'-phosphate oxidase family protein n=1 Tax=Lactobacillus sp. ESL0791 TaxID=2983234 RepID=UPI0023F769E4|nr:pyridoxamine 5'-phosphate oxidase family protein [Lactobacillus sp. ESL0791]MDF7639389.1 pyridoxamine 5'-phosphate oxidase family protein [Lactobacillus sp. ESL0791]